MTDIAGALYEIKHLDELSKRDNIINNIHPLVKLIVTLAYIGILASFDRYEVFALVPFIMYPAAVMIICEIPVGKIIKRVLALEPFIIVAGILNPILDKNTIYIGTVSISSGWLTLISLIIKSTLMVSAGFLLIASTGIDDIAGAMSLVKVPSIFVLLFLLTYRYIFVLMDEAERLIKGYTLRAPGQRGVKIKIWGPMIGQLLLRSFNRAQIIYQSMVLKGYNGKYSVSADKSFRYAEGIYLLVCVAFFIMSRLINIPWL
ncbi:cobalt ECF transporter T component CbiQ [Ruminiclostridium josui]|uniref:cobalt ECF transporter T component CbiQ n=1 Tax=Ruminiclostridium josui TaxID=1499 RepID=UPI0006D21EBE|nr:cobalt ECF transporter T component CbiQ [Ruminiclostridium josui]